MGLSMQFCSSPHREAGEPGLSRKSETCLTQKEEEWEECGHCGPTLLKSRVCIILASSAGMPLSGRCIRLLLFKSEDAPVFMKGEEFRIASPVDGGLQLCLRLLLTKVLLEEAQEVFFWQALSWGSLQCLHDLTHDADMGERLFTEDLLLFEDARLCKVPPLLC